MNPKAEISPFDSCAPDQQKSGRDLAKALMDSAQSQALQLMLEEIERLPRDGDISESKIEPVAAIRAASRR